MFPYERRWHQGKMIYKHREVMEETLGRPLLPGEVVHHINGDRKDNRPENLELCSSQGEHLQRHLKHDPRPILEAYARGLSSHRIAAELGIPRRTVSQIVSRHSLARTKAEAAVLMWESRG